MTGPYVAHRDFRQNQAVVVWFAGAGPISLAWLGVAHFVDHPEWWMLLCVLMVMVITLGAWYAREWARLTAGSIATLYGLSGFLAAVNLALQGRPGWSISFFGVAAIMAFLAWYSFRPSMKRRFAEARESISNARAGIS